MGKLKWAVSWKPAEESFSEIKEERQVRAAKKSQKMRIPLSLHPRPAPSNVPGIEETFKVSGRREIIFPC